MNKFFFLLIISFFFFNINISLAQENEFKYFTETLIGNNKSSKNFEYNLIVQNYKINFEYSIVKPIKNFVAQHIVNSGKSLFYPFAGADISYPLMFFPKVKTYILVGMEFPGDPDNFIKFFSISSFKGQVENFLRRGFFQTMAMSAEMNSKIGVIPMLLFQIAILGGEVIGLKKINSPAIGLEIDVNFNGETKKIFYFKINLDDSSNKISLLNFVIDNYFSDNCMLKASSYKLQQKNYHQLLDFITSHCSNILQDDTGVSYEVLVKSNFSIQMFGNYIKPFGAEFINYDQPVLRESYLKLNNIINLDFCYGYGCKIVDSNILFAKKPCINCCYN